MLRSSTSRSSGPRAFNNLVLAIMSLITVNVTELGKAASLYSKFFRSIDFNSASFHTYLLRQARVRRAARPTVRRRRLWC
jgi:hypothetical protein